MPAVPRSRTIVIAGGGIGGLTLALALARKGLRATVLEAAPQLDDAGAGIQLSPNASRVLIGLGLRSRLEPLASAPPAIRVIDARNGREIVRIPLTGVEHRYQAPYWVIHRGDLQAALIEACREQFDITLRFGARFSDHAVHVNGVTVEAQGERDSFDEHGIGVVGADGLWSTLRTRLGQMRPPRYSGRVAWRALLAADAVAGVGPDFATLSHLWLGRDAHVVHYPVRAGAAVNMVAIFAARAAPATGAPGDAAELAARFAGWPQAARDLMGLAEHWRTWPLYDRPPLQRAGTGPVALIGDAAHPMLPFAAQGGAMAIEDAAVLSDCLWRSPDDVPAAARRYEALRKARIARVVRAARHNGRIYHLGGALAMARNLAMRMLGGERLLARYDWLYDWRAER